MKNIEWNKCIIRADSRDVIKYIPDNSIDFIFTDPPYNLSKHSTGNIFLPGRSSINNDIADWDIIDFCPEDWADEFIRILKPTGNLFIFTSYNQIGRWYNCLDHRFDTSNFMIWHKTNPAPKIYKAGFLNSCEMIFTCWNKKHTWNFISQREMHNFIESAICMRPERLNDPKHPAQKPVSILKKIVKIASNKNDIIFDPFMGVGSIGVAALELDRRFVGIELINDYFQAAKSRLDKISTSKITDHWGNSIKKDIEAAEASDIMDTYQTISSKLQFFFQPNKDNDNLQSGLSPIIKWPGGKEKELRYIIPNIPKFNRFFEPFVGGGSVFMGIKANQYYINDFSSELIDLYKYIASSDKEFFRYANIIDKSWGNAGEFFHLNTSLIDIYIRYRDNLIGETELKLFIHSFCTTNESNIIGILDHELHSLPCILLNEMEANLFRKMVRIKVLEQEKHLLSDKDLLDNIETAIKSAVYMNFRHLYNDKYITIHAPKLHCALFLYIRNYSYSGMFRYSTKGEFNVPYGGIGYNRKQLKKKLDYYCSEAVLKHFADAHIYNMDFEEFLKEIKPAERDFVFLDPPYDTEFSTYARNAFTKSDQVRLANYLLKECKSKWMMIIKNTEFIYNLYNKEGVNIHSFDKEYRVSFMNRNYKKATHLLITNY